MLVVVAVIGILAAMLVPGTSKVVEKGRAMKCMNSLRQVGIAVQGYAADHDGRIPAAASAQAGSGNDLGNWYTDLSPFYQFSGQALSQWLTRAYATIQCPTFMKKYEGKPGYNVSWVGYGMNLRLNGSVGDAASTSMIQMRLAVIPNPTKTVLIGEGTGLNLDLSATGYKFTRDATQLEGWKKGGTPDRHGDFSNYLFVDGHIEALKQDAAEEILKPAPQS